MKTFSKKGVLLFAAAMALCAFVMPSMASAASWSPVGTETTLDSGNVGFTSTSSAFGAVTSSCRRSSFTGNIASAALLNITASSFNECVAVFPGAVATCTVTATGTANPWQATATTTSDIQIHNVRIDVFFEATPGNPSCATSTIAGRSIIITGTLTGGAWNGNGAGLRTVTYSNAEGLVFHSPSTGENNVAVTVRGSFTSTAAVSVVS